MRILMRIINPLLIMKLKNAYLPFIQTRNEIAEVLTKVMFTFSNDEILSPLALPKKLLHTIIDESLEYMEPRATAKQRALIEVIKNLKTRETFTPTKRGKLRQMYLDKIRKQVNAREFSMYIEDINKNNENPYNRKMKILTKSFYNILLECEKYDKTKHNEFINFLSL